MVEVSTLANDKVLEYLKNNNQASAIRIFLNEGG